MYYFYSMSYIVLLKLDWKFPEFAFTVSEACRPMAFSKYLFIDKKLILKFNLLQSTLCLTKAIFLLLFSGWLCPIAMTDNHNQERLSLMLVSLFLLYSQMYGVIKFSIPWRGELCYVWDRLHVFIMYHTTLKTTQKFRLFSLTNEHFPHLKESYIFLELHTFFISFIKSRTHGWSQSRGFNILLLVSLCYFFPHPPSYPIPSPLLFLFFIVLC